MSASARPSARASEAIGAGLDFANRLRSRSSAWRSRLTPAHHFARPLARPSGLSAAGYGHLVLVRINRRWLRWRQCHRQTGMEQTSFRSSSAIADALDALMLGAMGTAINLTSGLDAVTDHTAVAVRTTRCHGVNGAFDAVEGHGPAALRDAESFVVVSTANITSRHRVLLSSRRRPIKVYRRSTFGTAVEFQASSGGLITGRDCYRDDRACRLNKRIDWRKLGATRNIVAPRRLFRKGLFKPARSCAVVPDGDQS